MCARYVFFLQIHLFYPILIYFPRICGKHRVQDVYWSPLTQFPAFFHTRWKDMKVRIASSHPPSFSEPPVTTDAHHHRCRYCGHHRHHRCVCREDPEILDDFCTSNLFFHLHFVCCIYALFNLRPSARDTRRDVLMSSAGDTNLIV